jgi:cell wall-associated NlpC family hydrolase
MNPGVRWRSLQIGQQLNVPGVRTRAPIAQAPAPRREATGSIVVRQGDNDWTLARRAGVSVAEFRAMNPGIAWRSLQIGQRLRAPGATASQSERIATKRAKITRDSVIVRRGPSTDSARVTQVNQGRVATIVDRENGWYKLRFDGGSSGWVRGDLLSPVSAAAVASARPAQTPRAERIVREAPRRVAAKTEGSSGLKLLDTANRYRGVRYRFGGTTSRGFDCSGFVSHVFRTHGIRLPRTSQEQATVGQPVAKNELRKGDLVFFRTRGSRISHVGIYIDGGNFIHSSSGGGKVEVDSLTSGYYARRFAGARRVSNRLAPSAPKQTERVARAESPAAENPAPPKPEPPTIERQRRESVGTDEIAR